MIFFIQKMKQNTWRTSEMKLKRYIELLNKDLDNSIVNLIILANGINIENVWYNYIKHNINLSTNV